VPYYGIISQTGRKLLSGRQENKMDIKELMDLLKSNPELLAQLQETFITPDVVTQAIESKNPAVMPAVDKVVTKAIEGFKEKGMQTILAAKKEEWKNENYSEFAKQHGINTDPKYAELQKEVALLKQQVTEKEIRERKSAINAEVTQKLADKKMPLKLATFISANTSEEATAAIDALSTMFNDVVTEQVKDKLKSTTTIPGESKPGHTDTNPFSKTSFNLTKQAELIRNEPEKARELQQLALGEK